MTLLASAHRRMLSALLLGAAALLASCGGGDPIVPFQPVRVLAFGDENSLLTSEGRKYTVNTLIADDQGVKTLNCQNGGIWVQRLAADFGFVFPQCNPNNVANPPSRIYATAGAKAADLEAQIQQHLSTPDGFAEKDLVTLLVGQHDVLEQYALYDGTNAALLLDRVYQAGLTLAAQVKRIADAGGKVLVSTVPDLAYSPFAVAENTAAGNNTPGQLLGALAAKFNEGLRVGIAGQSGAEVAIMLTDELIQTMAKFPASFGMSNVIAAACNETLAPTVDQCTTDTLVTGATANNHLWADDTHISAGAHLYLGSLAVTRARGNPF